MDIWDRAYALEYTGLQQIPVRVSISEAEYTKMKHLCKGVLPTMTIATIKHDEKGNPKQAKYRIVPLRNLDPNSRTQEECYALVMNFPRGKIINSISSQE